MNTRKFLLFAILLLTTYKLSAQDDMESLIPDPVFRAYLLERFDTNQDGWLDEAERNAVDSITIGWEDETVRSLKGLELFVYLRVLDVDRMELTKLDVSRNIHLTELNAGRNNLRSLDISRNTKLEYLDISGNSITELNFANNPLLVYLEVGSNPLQTLDVSGLKNLRELHLSNWWWEYGQLSSIDVSQNRYLERLSLTNNSIETLDVSNNPRLERLWAGNNQITTIDLSNNPKLKSLSIDRNQLTSLDVSNSPKLEELRINHNQLTSLDVSNNPQLVRLYVHHNKLRELSLEHNVDLRYLNCSHNELVYLNLANQHRLRRLTCNNNQLRHLILPQRSSLSEINTAFNQLETLNISAHRGLNRLNISNNRLTTLDFTNNHSLHLLDVDFSENPNLTFVILSNYQLRLQETLAEIRAKFQGLDAEALFHLVPFREDRVWGMLDSRNKQVVVAPRFCSIELFNPSATGFISVDFFYPNGVVNFAVSLNETGGINVEHISGRRRNLTGARWNILEKGFSVDEEGNLTGMSSYYRWVTPFRYQNNFYGIAQRRTDELLAVIDTLGNTKPHFDFRFEEIRKIPYAPGWFLVSDAGVSTTGHGSHRGYMRCVRDATENNTLYFKNWNGEVKTFGGIKCYQRPLFGYSVVTIYGQEQMAVLDLTKMDYLIQPQQELVFQRLEFASKTELDTSNIEHRAKAKIYIRVEKNGSVFFMDLDGNKMIPAQNQQAEFESC